jgi:Domain of unknown function (DUF4124)
MGVRGWLILVAVVLTLTGPTWSQVYKWVDQAGVTQYGSAPPTEASATLIQPAASANPAAASSAPEPAHQAGKGMQPAGRDADGRAREGSDPIGWKQAEAERLKLCAFARQQLDVLTLGGPVFRRDARGGRQYLPDEAREGEIARMRAEVARQCAGLDSDAATQLRWRQINNFVLCDRARSLLQAHNANRSRVSNQEYEKVTRLVEESCAPGRFPAETGHRGEWFRQYILPGELRQ